MAEQIHRLVIRRRKAVLRCKFTATVVLVLLSGMAYAQNPTDSGNRGAQEFGSTPGYERNMPVRRTVDKTRNFRVYAPTKNLTTHTSEPKVMQRVDEPASTTDTRREMQPAGLSRANRVQRTLPMPSIDDLERQIGALEDKLDYARRHPELFAESDIVKMEGALDSKRNQLVTLKKTDDPE